MVTKKELIRVAREGNWFNRQGSEQACNECGKYDWEGGHEEDCALGALLKSIEENFPKDENIPDRILSESEQRLVKKMYKGKL